MEEHLKHAWWYGAGIVIIVFLGYFFFLSAPSGFVPGTIVGVESGQSLGSIALEMKDDHIVRSAKAFKAFVILYGGEKHIVTGDYLFKERMPVFEVAFHVARGLQDLPPVKLTIPEGFTNVAIAQTAAALIPHFNETNFLTEAASKQGYLFPDTYFFAETDTEDKVIEEMSENYEKKIAPLRNDITASGRTEAQIITMASIIEGEAAGDADRGVIAGILWKRFDQGMLLEVDAAPITYKERGLPASPVSNPGLAAIMAAIHPTPSPYLFYLHDSTGTVHYAKTFAEHQANIAKYLK